MRWNCYFIFQDVLDMPSQALGETPWRFSVADLLIKMATVKNQFIMKMRADDENKERQPENKPGKVTIHEFQISPEYIESVLDRLENILMWVEGENNANYRMQL